MKKNGIWRREEFIQLLLVFFSGFSGREFIRRVNLFNSLWPFDWIFISLLFIYYLLWRAVTFFNFFHQLDLIGKRLNFYCVFFDFCVRCI